MNNSDDFNSKGNCVNCLERAVDEFQFETAITRQLFLLPLCGYCFLQNTMNEDWAGDREQARANKDDL